MTDRLVSVEWLKKSLKNDHLIILDASPATTISNVKSAFEHQIIPGSLSFNIKENFTNKESKFPNTFPSAQQFEKECRNLGINKSSQIIVYDNLGIYTSPRVWWMFKTMGHENIAVLNGGLPEWINKGFQTVQKGENKKHQLIGDFEAQFKNVNIKLYKSVLDNISSHKYLLIDARSSGRFNGTEKEPREYLQSGHIRNSINIPYKTVLKNGKYKSPKELKELFKKKSIGPQNLVFSCGSGLTACIVLLASELVLKNNTSVYDGSWTEWAELQNLKT